MGSYSKGNYNLLLTSVLGYSIWVMCTLLNKMKFSLLLYCVVYLRDLSGPYYLLFIMTYITLHNIIFSKTTFL